MKNLEKLNDKFIKRKTTLQQLLDMFERSLITKKEFIYCSKKLIERNEDEKIAYLRQNNPIEYINYLFGKNEDEKIKNLSISEFLDEITSENKKIKYKARAEFIKDVFQICRTINGIEKVSIELDDYGFPDVDFTFESTKSLCELIDEMKKIVDIHVVRQTLNKIGDYTGKRNFDID